MKTNKFMKVFVYVLVACLLLVGGGVLSACDPNGEPSDNHTHQWAEKYSYDDEYHYYECTVEGCDQHTGTELHEYDDDQDATCNKCDYERHVHTLTWKWDEDPNGNHWKEYACEHHADEKLELGKHDFSGENPNVCKVCGYDKTPPHTHHEVTKYDENQHWTSYDCEEHKDEKINPQDHTYENDPNHEKCDGCGYNRGVEHEHSVSETWSNDATSHWKIYTCWHHDKEQLEKADHEWEYEADTNKDECKVCHYSVAHDHTKYQYTEKVDADQHWKSYTCHPNEKVDAASHYFGEEDAEACSCGLEHIYLDVYALYSANQTYVGNEADAFGDWYEAVKAEENFDHVALNTVGDAVFYYKKAAGASGFDEIVKYFAPRTYTVKAVAGTPTKGIESVWFTVKATVDGQPKQIAGGKAALDLKATGSEGAAQLTFTPVWGYSSDTVVYTVNVADKEDMGNNPFIMPGNYLYDGDGKALSVSATAPSESTETSFTLTQCLGLGDRYKFENQYIRGGMENKSMSYKARLMNDIAEGWYLVKMKTVTGSDGILASNGMLLTVEGGEAVDQHVSITKSGTNEGGYEGYYMVYLTSECKQLSFYSVGATLVVDIWLEKHVQEADFSDALFARANGTSEKHKIVYNIKSGSIKAGRYIVSTGYEKTSAKFDDGEPVSLTTGTVFTLKGTEKTVEFSYDSEESYVFKGLRLVPIEALSADNIQTMEFNEDNMLYAYSWTPTKTATYRMTISAPSTYKNVTVKIGSTQVITGSTLSTQQDDGYSQVGYFAATGNKECYIQLSRSLVDAVSITLKIEEETTSPIQANEEFTLEFDGLHMSKYLTGQFEPGLYAVISKAATDIKFSLSYVEQGESSNSRNTNVQLGTVTGGYSSGLFYVTEEYAKTEGKVDVRFSTSYGTALQGKDKASFTVKFVKVSTINSTNIGATSQVTFDDNSLYAFEFNPDNSIFNLSLTSSGDLSFLKLMYCTISDSAISAGLLADIVADKTGTREYTTSSAVKADITRYIVLLSYQKPESKPTDVQLSIKKAFKNPDLVAHNNDSSGTSGSGGQSGNFRAGIGFAAVENATTYELYEAVSDDATAPAISEFKLVKTYTSEDATKYKVSSAGTSTFNYINNDPDNSNKYFYYYLKVSGGDEYAPYITKVVQGHTFAYSGNARRTYKVKLDIPEELVGKTFFISLTQSETQYIFGFDFVTPTSTSQTFTILSTELSSGLIVTGTKDWDYQAYNFPEKQTVSPCTASNEVVTTINVAKNAAIGVTLNLPEDFAIDNGWLRVYLYQGENKVATTSVSRLDLKSMTDNKLTLKFYVDKIAPEDKDNYYIVFGLEEKDKLADGFVLPEKVKVTVDEGLMTGTAEATFAERCAIDLTLKLPEYFAGGDVTISAYIQNEDGSLEKDASTTNVVSCEAGGASATNKHVTIYVPIGHKYTVKLAFDKNSGYTADDVADIDGTNKTGKATINVNGVIDVTVTVNLEDGLTLTATTIYLYDKENTNTTIVSGVVKFEEGASTAQVHLSVPIGLKDKQFVIGSYASANQIGTTSYCWTDYAEVTLDDNGVTGTATFELQKSYGIHLHVTHDYSSSKSDTFYVIMNGVQIYSSSVQFNSFSGGYNNHDRHVYVPVQLYKDGSKFYTYADIKDTTLQKTWICPEVEFTFAPGSKDVDVTLGHTQNVENATVKVTINFPEGFEAGSSSYTFGVYKPGATTASKSTSIKSADITEALTKGNVYSFDFADYIWTASSYYMLNDLYTISKSTDSGTPKKYYCEPSYAVWEESAQAYVLTINIKETPQVEVDVNVEAPKELTAEKSQSFSVTVKDKDGKQVASLSLTLDQGVSTTTLKSTFLSFAEFDAELIGGMTATATFNDAHYSVSAEIVADGDSFSVKVTFAKQRATDFIVNLKFDGFSAQRGESYNFRLNLYAAGDRKTALSTQSININSSSNVGKSEIKNAKTFTWAGVWAEGEYEIVVERPNYTNEFVCIVEVVKAETGEDTYYVNVTCKKC